MNKYRIHCKLEEDSFDMEISEEVFSNIGSILNNNNWIDFGDRILRVESIVKVTKITHV